jgi:hypothetical protein
MVLLSVWDELPRACIVAIQYGWRNMREQLEGEVLGSAAGCGWLTECRTGRTSSHYQWQLLPHREVRDTGVKLCAVRASLEIRYCHVPVCYIPVELKTSLAPCIDAFCLGCTPSGHCAPEQ